MSNNPNVNNPPQGHIPYQAPIPPVEPKKKFSYWAIISLIAGILNFKYPPLGAIAALITGYVARNEIRDSNGTMDGNGMATAGIVLGWIGIVFSVIVFVLVVLLIIGVISFTPAICGSFFDWINV